MSEYVIIQKDTLTAMGDAIRETTGENKLYTVDEMYKKLGHELINKLTNDAAVLTYVPEGITKIREGAFADKRNITFTALPEGLTHIGGYAFRNAWINSMSLPDGLTHIGDYAFASTQIESICFPESLISIDEYAFFNNYSLNSVTFKGTPSYIDKTAFFSTSLTTINVPWAEGKVAGAPWGARGATINYNYVE